MPAEGIGQYKARVFLGDAQFQQARVIRKKGFPVRAPILARAIRHDKARAGKIHIAPGFHHIRRQPVLDHELLHENARPIKSQRHRMVFQRGHVPGKRHFMDQLPVGFVCRIFRKNFYRAALRGGNAPAGGIHMDAMLRLRENGHPSLSHLRALQF